MRILLSNDDGYLAPGLLALREALHKAGFDAIETAAPEQNCSAQSNALTLSRPLLVQRAANGMYCVNGTPADSVHVILSSGLLPWRPDLVLSGINNGANMGDDTIYSGTVAAAMEGYLYGIPSIAFSLVERGWRHLADVAHAAADFVRLLASPSEGFAPQLPTASDAAAPGAWLLNINFPCRAYAEMGAPATWPLTRLGRRHAAERVICQKNPNGEDVYWIGAAGDARDSGEGTDFFALSSGRPSITPLCADLTDQGRLSAWRTWLRKASAA